jgi:GTPase
MAMAYMNCWRKSSTVLPEGGAEEITEPIRVAIVGRPNVGKSSLVNAILGEDRQIVSDIPGTTRDTIDTQVQVNGRDYLLIDTAGIRRKGKVYERIEKYAVVKAMDAIARCDVALIMIDAADGIVEQDIKIAGYAYEKGRACIFLLNKWDLVEKDDATFKKYKEDLAHQASYMSYAPFLTISALTGRRVPKIFEAIDGVYEQFIHRSTTGPLNRIITRATESNEPSMFRGRRLKFFYATQITTKPPAFVCFVNYPEGVHFSYQRYLVNQIREALALDKVPIQLFLRKRGGESTEPRRPKKPVKKTTKKHTKKMGRKNKR